MRGVITYDLSDRFIDKLADEITAAYAPAAWPRLAFVFGGRRRSFFSREPWPSASARQSFRRGFSRLMNLWNIWSPVRWRIQPSQRPGGVLRDLPDRAKAIPGHPGRAQRVLAFFTMG
jgi:hypothetical protein